MDRNIYDLPAFREKIHTNVCGIYHVNNERAVVYYFKDGQYIASAHEHLQSIGKYSKAMQKIVPKKMWRVTHQQCVDSIEDLYQVYQDEIKSEWLKD